MLTRIRYAYSGSGIFVQMPPLSVAEALVSDHHLCPLCMQRVDIVDDVGLALAIENASKHGDYMLERILLRKESFRGA